MILEIPTIILRKNNHAIMMITVVHQRVSMEQVNWKRMETECDT